MTWLVLGASAAILVLAFLLRLHAQRRLAALDLAGEVVYRDGGAAAEVLVSHQYGLIGKPDYIRREGEELIPVEQNRASSRQSAPTKAKYCSSRHIAYWWRSDSESRCGVASSCTRTVPSRSRSMTSSVPGSSTLWPN